MKKKYIIFVVIIWKNWKKKYKNGIICAVLNENIDKMAKKITPKYFLKYKRNIYSVNKIRINVLI